MAGQAIQISMVPMAVWSLDTNIAPGSGPDPGISITFNVIRSDKHSFRPWLQYGHKPGHGSSMQPRIRCQYGHKCQHRPSRLSRPQWKHGPWRPTWTQVFDQNPVIYMTFSAHQSPGHKHRPRLLQGNGPRHGPWHQPRPDVIMFPGWQHSPSRPT